MFSLFRAKLQSQRLITGLMAFIFLAMQTTPIMLFSQTANAATTGFKIPTAAHAPNNWDVSVVESIQSSNDQYVSENDGQEQGYAHFALGVPAGSTVNGITVQTEAKSTDDNDCRLGVALSWDNGATFTSSEYHNLLTTDTTETHGGANNTWGRSWTSTELTDANFVVRIQDNDPGQSCANDALTSVDLLQVKVEYTEPTPVTTNPTLTQACGLDIALVIDRSTSIDSSEMGQMKTALNAFVDALDETPTQFSVTRFGTDASVAQGFTADSSLVTTAINNTTNAGGTQYTNWEAAINTANTTFDPRPSIPNLMLFATDGDPTTSGDGSSIDTNQPNAHLDPAKVAANTVKNADTRVVPIGIGMTAGSLDRLKAISGPTDSGPIQSRDVIVTDNFETLAADLAAFAEATCGGTITTTKLVDHDNSQYTPPVSGGAGWNFIVDGNSYATNANGQTMAVDIDAGTYTVTEGVREGYAIVSGSCSGATNNGQFNAGQRRVEGLVVGNSDIVSCTFVNRPTKGTMIVKKVIDGGDATYSDFSFKVNAGNLTPFEADGSNSVTLHEGAYKVEEQNVPASYEASYSYDCEGMLKGGETKTCTITNKAVSPTLQLVKSVINNNGGAQSAVAWTLIAKAGNQAPLISEQGSTQNGGQTASTGTYNAVAGVVYVLSETGPVGYAPGSWSCTGGTLYGNMLTLSVAQEVVCTITNDDVAPKLRLVKEVVNDNGGEASESDFTPHVNGNATSWGTHDLTPGEYTVSEQALVSGYKQTDLKCYKTGSNPLVLVQHPVSLNLGDDVTCKVTNDDVAPKVKVKKYAGPDTEQAFNFTLTNKGSLYGSFGMSDGGSYSTGADLDAGNVSIEENVPNGWRQLQAYCYNKNDGWLGTDFEAKLGEYYKCTFVNEQLGEVTVVKDAQPNHEQNFTFTLNQLAEQCGRDTVQTLSLCEEMEASSEVSMFDSFSHSFVLDDDMDPALSSKKTTQVEPGLYTITEDQVAGWSLDSISCGDVEITDRTDTSVSFAVAAGQKITCTFVNTQDPTTPQVLGEMEEKPAPQAVLANTGDAAMIYNSIFAASLGLAIAVLALVKQKETKTHR